MTTTHADPSRGPTAQDRLMARSRLGRQRLRSRAVHGDHAARVALLEHQHGHARNAAASTTSGGTTSATAGATAGGTAAPSSATGEAHGQAATNVPQQPRTAAATAAQTAAGGGGGAPPPGRTGHRVGLLISAAAMPDGCFPGGCDGL